MKIKDAHTTANMNGGHKYLGHFGKKKFINAGHNTSAVVDVFSKGIEKVGRAFNTEHGKALKAADAAVAPAEEAVYRFPRGSAMEKTDKTARRKQLDKAIDGADGSQD